MKKNKLEYVEVVENKLLSEEPLDTLVRVPFYQLLELGMEKFLQNLSVLAIGMEDSGQFKINDIAIHLVGAVNQEVIFNVKGTLQKFKTETKKLPKIQEQKEVKKAPKKNKKTKK